jgi:predicted flap endonuclease-1-like 5' DNA nuclease
MLIRLLIFFILFIIIAWWYVRDNYIQEIKKLKLILKDLQINQSLDEFAKEEIGMLKEKILTLEAQLEVYRKSVGDKRPHGTMNSISKIIRKDDLKIVEGIGPKIEELFNKSGVFTFEQLAKMPASEMKQILEKAGSRFQIHDPTTWAEQAAMARDNRWAELKRWQDILDKGRIV